MTKVEQSADRVAVTVETPAGAYVLETDWLVDATGVNSAIRDGFALETHTARSADRPHRAPFR